MDLAPVGDVKFGERCGRVILLGITAQAKLKPFKGKFQLYLKTEAELAQNEMFQRPVGSGRTNSVF